MTGMLANKGNEMRILKCDKCGHEERDTCGIVGSEFKYHGFETLSPAYRFGDVVDVCAKCFKDVQQAARDAEKYRRQVERKSFLQRLGIVG